MEFKKTIYSVSVAENIVGDQIVGPNTATSLLVCIAKAPFGSYVLSLPETMWVHSLLLEGHVTYVLVTYFTSRSVTFKSGVIIDSFEVADSLSFQDPPYLVIVVFDGTANSNDTADLITQFESCVNVWDGWSLLNLLVNHKCSCFTW